MPAPATDFLTCIEVFNDEFNYVFRLLRRHGVAAGEAEDLVQEVFLVMWRRWAQYDHTRPLRPWLAGIAFRVAHRHRRRGVREVPGGLLDVPDTRSDPEQNMATGRARSLVWTVLDSLPEKHRSLLLIHYVDDVGLREIADTLAAPLPTIRTRLRAARTAFGKALKQLQTVTAARAGLAALLRGEPTGSTPLDEEDWRVRRWRALVRIRRLLLVPGSGLPARPPLVPPRSAALTAPAALRAWLAVGGAVVFAMGVLLAAIAGDSRSSSGVFQNTPSVSMARVVAAPTRTRVLIPIARAPTAPTFAAGASSVGDDAMAASPELSLGRSLVGYWRFDEPQGSNAARDLSGNGNDCILRKLDPGAAWTQGRLGGAVTLDGEGWLECPRVDALAGVASNLTISLWLRQVGSQKRVRAVVSRQHGSSGRDTFHLGFRDDEIWLRTRHRGQATRATFPPQRGLWHHVTATLDAGGRTRLFIDGAEVSNRLRDAQAPLGGGNNPLILGGGVNGPSDSVVNERFRGIIDELAIHARSLDSAEIRALASGAQPRLPP